MEWLNYHHLYYFWTTVREGSIAAASRRLSVGRPSISMQLKALEGFLGAPLFTRRGRNLELTATGKLVEGYAEDIFRTGEELVDAVRGRPTGSPLTLRVGIADVVAKPVAFKLLEPVLELGERVLLECSEDDPKSLFAQLAIHELDLVLSDIPLAPGFDVRAYNHLLGQSTTTLFATADRVRELQADFPRSLDGAPFLMPARNTSLRHSLERWLEAEDLHPVIVGNFADGALLKVFGQSGLGVFPAPTVVRAQIEAQYDVRALGELTGVKERFYAISPERRVKHPAVMGILAKGRRDFGG